MRPILIHDKQRLLSYFGRNAPLHVYCIGDLDDFYWPFTTWYASPGEDPPPPEGARPRTELAACALLYTRSSLPVLLALHEDPVPMVRLIESVVPFLPRRMYAHLTPGVEEGFRESYRFTSHGLHLKMALAERAKLDGIDTSRARPIAWADLPALLSLLEAGYPGNWFDPEMLQSGRYFGLWEGGRPVAAAGVHVCSPTYGVAALGNIVTHPDHRGRGYGRLVTARVCQELLRDCPTIGLNVKADNAPAVACYSGLGFETVGRYHEVMMDAVGG